MELLLIFFSLAFLGFFGLFIHAYDLLWLKPERLRAKLRRQGIRGPKPSFLVGNIPEMKKIKSTAVAKSPNEHDCASTIFPFFEQWREKYGRNFMFSLGNVQLLYVTDPYVAKEISLCTSLDLGKQAYQQKERGALLGQGILTSNGPLWAYQRKTIAPHLFMDKVKGMVNLMSEAARILVKSWDSKIEGMGGGGIADIRADEVLRTFSSYIISKTLFGGSYTKGTNIFLKLRALQKALSTPSLLTGVPGLRYLPTKSNREIWRLEKEIQSMILKIVKERSKDSCEKDLLQMIIEGANSGDIGADTSSEQFIVDNCKNIYLAGYETTAISALWGLMLLASHPEWQGRVRAEVFEVCGGKVCAWQLSMVTQEVLRLYPPAAFVSREALQEMKFGDIHIPKGVNVWVSVLTLHQDPEIWGPDADKFNPERFAAGLLSASKLPQAYIPFGVGPRICAGQNFALRQRSLQLRIEEQARKLEKMLNQKQKNINTQIETNNLDILLPDDPSIGLKDKSAS
ncbi:hypothetical protein HHK36_017409 [Tetracentron sinense]|uniref:Cytochrome P450 n=1 Tax=Tetracentron sinense TaxID=13715 RepID=A0A834Z1A1_TETSI|nr:hypothetical protein HHK36_017409 [Tetracentron sinense]